MSKRNSGHSPCRDRSRRGIQRPLDDPATQALLASIKHHRLTRGYGALWSLEGDTDPLLVDSLDGANLIRLTVSNFRRAVDRALRRLPVHPAHASRFKASMEQHRVVVPLADDQNVTL